MPHLNLEYKNYVLGLEGGFEEACLDLDNVSFILMEVRSISIGLLVRPVRSALHSTLTFSEPKHITLYFVICC